MKKSNYIFLFILSVLLLIFIGCMGKIDRTFGPLKIAIETSNELYMGNTITLTASIGFEPYTWDLVSDSSGSTLTKISDNEARLELAYDSLNESYSITIGAKDSKGNMTERSYIVTRVPIKQTNSWGDFKYKLYCNNSGDKIYISVDPKDMPDFDHWVITSGPVTLDNPNTYSTVMSPNGSGTTGLVTFYAQNSRGQRSMLGKAIVYDTRYIYSNSAKDGYISHDISSGTNIANSTDTIAKVGYETFPQAINRAFFSFDIPNVGTIFEAHLTVYIDSHEPKNVLSNRSVYFKYIGRDVIPSASLTGAIFPTLNGDVTEANHFYYLWHSYYIDYANISFSSINGEWDYNPFIIDRLNYCSGHAFDIGFRFDDENFSEYSTINYITSDSTSNKPNLYILYY